MQRHELVGSKSTPYYVVETKCEREIISYI